MYSGTKLGESGGQEDGAILTEKGIRCFTVYQSNIYPVCSECLFTG